MLDPRSPYSRRMWHYEPDRPLSLAQVIALGSLDASTAALLWLLVERHQSLIVSGPTDPTPGVGKTTTLNALLDFLPAGSTLVYTTGMYEDFDFRQGVRQGARSVDPATTCVLANEVSDHLRIYMWGRVARTFLSLPEEGFAIATSCHADTVEDVLQMLQHDLRLPAETVARLGVIVNIGIVGRVWPPRRRFLSVNLLRPALSEMSDAAGPDAADQVHSKVHSKASAPEGVHLVSLASWDAKTDSQRPPTDEALDEVAQVVGLSRADLNDALHRRRVCLEVLAAGQGVNRRAFREAVEELQAAEADAAQGSPGAADAGDKQAES